MQMPDLTKLAWQLNVALIGAAFSAIALIYNEKFIYYGFVTFLFGIISHFFGTWFEFVYSGEEQKKKRQNFYLVQSIILIIWIASLLNISGLPLKLSISNTITLSSNQSSTNNKEWIVTIFSILAGGIVGFGTVILVEKLKEPQIVFEVGSKDDDPTNKRRFIHIKIRNLDRKFLWSPLTTNIASSAKSMVKIDDKFFVGRWTSKAEPLVYGAGGKPIAVNLNEVLVIPREDICPANDDSEAVHVAIGMKYETEDKFYGFNNKSYLYQTALKNPDYEFGLGSFKGEITITTLGKQYKQRFVVYNRTTHTKDFHLELINS